MLDQARHPPRDIMTREAFENAITVVIALGGSTNAVLHLLAMAHAAGVELTIDDFTRIGKRVPVLADLKPSGKYVMADLVDIGGTVPLMKMLLDAGLLHGDCLTVTGRTLRENLESSRAPIPTARTSSARSTIRSRTTATCASSTATSRRRRRGRQDHRQGGRGLHGQGARVRFRGGRR